jgi:hypothetical protein
VESWLQSGLSQKAFSLRHHLPVHVLVYWVSRYRKVHPAPANTAASFIRLCPPAASPATEMTVELPSGVVIRFSSLVSVTYLQELVKGCSH